MKISFLSVDYCPVCHRNGVFLAPEPDFMVFEINHVFKTRDGKTCGAGTDPVKS